MVTSVTLSVSSSSRSSQPILSLSLSSGVDSSLLRACLGNNYEYVSRGGGYGVTTHRTAGPYALTGEWLLWGPLTYIIALTWLIARAYSTRSSESAVITRKEGGGQINILS